jgi:hypothetical protein
MRALFSASPVKAAPPDPCASAATVSPCFDADPWWIPTGPTPFAGVPSARTLPAKSLSLVVGAGVSVEPVVLVTASPHPEGQRIDVVEATSTLTLGARYGLGRGVDIGLAVPFVPYQTGSGAESVTSQAGQSLDPVALRDPRVGFAALLLGRSPGAPLLLTMHLGTALPLGDAGALAGAAGFTVAPGFTGELSYGRLDAALDLGVRLMPAVSFASVREGSYAVIALGVSVTALQAPKLAFAVEGTLRPSLVDPPARAATDSLDLPAEWLASARLEPAPRWSLLLGAGSGLPLSTARSPGSSTEHVFGVTAPSFRGVFTARYTLPAVL